MRPFRHFLSTLNCSFIDEIKRENNINTNNTRERQAFSATHELGHICRVDQRVRERVPFECDNDAEMNEKIIDRFAAELLMPRDLFIEAINNWFKETK